MLYLKLQNSNSRSLENAVIKVAKLFSLEPPAITPSPEASSVGAPIFGQEPAGPSRLQ